MSLKLKLIAACASIMWMIWLVLAASPAQAQTVYKCGPTAYQDSPCEPSKPAAQPSQAAHEAAQALADRSVYPVYSVYVQDYPVCIAGCPVYRYRGYVQVFPRVRGRRF